MNEKAYTTLEYDKIIRRLTDIAQTAAGKDLCRKLEPMTDRAKILAAQKETSDAENRIIAKGGLSFTGTADVRASVMRLDVGASLGTRELLAIAGLLRAAGHARNYGRREDREDPDSLESYFAGLEPLTTLAQEIARCILAEDEIADEASPGLSKIRRRIKGTGEKVHTELSLLLRTKREYLQDGVVTMRDGRYCIPVKAEYRGQVPGIVHDQSGSGSTFFIEPMSIVRLNNELRELEIQEQKEIEAVLADLSARRPPQYPEELRTDYEVLTHLDFVFAKAQLSRRYRGTEPQFSDDRFLLIRQGRHPLLPAKSVVPIDIGWAANSTCWSSPVRTPAARP